MKSRSSGTVLISNKITLTEGLITPRPARRGDTPVQVGERPIVVGREPGCQLVLDDRKVSAVHFELVALPGGVRLRDLGSKNGTLVAGIRVVECFLTEPCTIECGDSKVNFEFAGRRTGQVSEQERFGPLLGRSIVMRRLFERCKQVAGVDLPALVLGENGSGKELVARAIHEESRRARSPFVVFDCSAVAPSDAEVALFGEAVKGNGAPEHISSPFADAEGGTLFLDEVGDLPPDVQAKLIAALNAAALKPVGAKEAMPFDVRVIAASRRDLVKEVNSGNFRSELYFKLANLRLDVPPLRERMEDVPLLVRRLIADCGGDPAFHRVRGENLERLLRHDWPGNVRELKNAVSVAVSLATERDLDVAGQVSSETSRRVLGTSALESWSYDEAKRRALERFGQQYFAGLLAITSGNISEIARVSGLERAHVRRHLRAYGLYESAHSQRKQA